MTDAQTGARVVTGPSGLDATAETRLLLLTGHARAAAIDVQTVGPVLHGVGGTRAGVESDGRGNPLARAEVVATAEPLQGLRGVRALDMLHDPERALCRALAMSVTRPHPGGGLG
jgi:hypothetical protein